MAHKPGLGRGLEALIPSSDSPPSSGIAFLPVDKIQPNPRQPRTRFDPQEISDLAESVRAHGVIQPLIVSMAEIPGNYILIAGERRLVAARQVGLLTIPAIIREVNDQQRLEIALIENIQRTDLGPLEAAEAYRQLADEFGLSHEEISNKVGKSRTSITNTLRLLKLPDSAQRALIDGKISEGHARALLGLPTPQALAALLQVVMEKNLSVRQTEELVQKYQGEKPASPKLKTRSPEISALEEQLRVQLGTKVKLNNHKKGGTLVIHYYSQEELDALVTKLLGE
jgi:ParB family chromosome partitioning protein